VKKRYLQRGTGTWGVFKGCLCRDGWGVGNRGYKSSQQRHPAKPRATSAGSCAVSHMTISYSMQRFQTHHPPTPTKKKNSTTVKGHRLSIHIPFLSARSRPSCPRLRRYPRCSHKEVSPFQLQPSGHHKHKETRSHLYQRRYPRPDPPYLEIDRPAIPACLVAPKKYNDDIPSSPTRGLS
jgi:hypothetical protein